MDVAISTLLLIGTGLMVLAAVGVLKLPDVFGRLQAGTKAASLGLAFVFAGTALAAPGAVSVAKLLLAVAFQFATAPVAAHVIGRAAYRSGAPMWEGTVVDELGRDVAPEPGGGTQLPGDR
jgi:multicomponent Na+:H+ antiporter subunit G